MSARIVSATSLARGGRPVQVCLFVVDEDRDLLAVLTDVVAALEDAAREERDGPRPFADTAAQHLSKAPEGWDDLTHRELDVLDLVARGHDNTAIARYLGISVRTVRNHLNSVFSKLGVDYRPQAVVLAREAGLGLTPLTHYA